MISKTDNTSFPLVELNTTLYDLLQAEQNDGETSVETLCSLKPNSDKSMGTAVPLSDKYIIHSAQVDDKDDFAHLQLEICSYLLMFFAGPMNVIFLAADGETDDKSLWKDAVDKSAKRSFAVIQESQRPKIRTFANIEDFVANHDGTKIRWGFAMDFAERLPYFIHPEQIYNLNSKRWLAASNELKSANDQIIDCEIQCPNHQHNNQWYYGGEDCASCTSGIKSETERILSIIESRPPPFVLKLTQSLSAVGTNIIKTDGEKSKLLTQIREYLTSYLPRITKSNINLYTTALILSDHLDGETMALNFFIRRSGPPIFLGACHQLATGQSGGQSTAITYTDQSRLEPKYRATLDRISRALQKEGYHGAIGADIMEDSDGKFNTIDLNVRTPLSLLLYLLRTHFHEKRGYDVALVYECLVLGISREELEERFHSEFEQARIVLLGSTRLGETKKKWAFGMVLAGEAMDEVKRLGERISELQAKE